METVQKVSAQSSPAQTGVALLRIPVSKSGDCNCVCSSADTVYHLSRVASHPGDPYYETLCGSKLTDVLRFRQFLVPRPCMPLSIPLLLPQRQFARMVRSALDQCLSISEDHLIPYHIPTTRIISASHPKIKDVLCIAQPHGCCTVMDGL